MANDKPKRAATNSAQAKHAAAIAAAEAREDVAQQKKPRGRPKKVPVQQQVPALAPTVEPEDPEDPEAGDTDEGILIDWTHALTWSLITAIETNEEICNALFPGVGAIKLKDGKPKTHYQYLLAVICFATHPEYQEAFSIDPNEKAPVLAKHRALWGEKIKNKIKTLVKKTRSYIQEMGETGAGIASEAEILPGTALTTKWDVIKADSPWFFHVRALIAARPNLQPVGLGNNEDTYEIDILMGIIHDDDTSSVPEDTPDLPEQLEDPVADVPDDDSAISDSEDDAISGAVSLTTAVKRKRGKDPKTPRTDLKPAKKLKGPLPATSAPATPAASAKKAATTKDRFSAAVAAEEETAQHLLRLKHDKTIARKEVSLAKIQAEAKLRAEREEGRREDKAERRALMRLKLTQDHEARMAQIHSQAGSSSLAFSGSTDRSSHHRSDFPSSSQYEAELPRLPAHAGFDGDNVSEHSSMYGTQFGGF